MFQLIFANFLLEVILVLFIIVIIIFIVSVYVIRDLKVEYKRVYKIRSRFHIEMRKIVNLIYNLHKTERLEAFTQVVIKKLPHAEKSILLKSIDEVYKDFNYDDPDNKYIVETYNNLQNLRTERDTLIVNYNKKIKTFPYSIVARIMKMKSYQLYTEKK